MIKRNLRLPKDGAVEPDGLRLTDSEDVEGHGLPITAPPSISRRAPGHGGENIPTPVEDDDVEGDRSH